MDNRKSIALVIAFIAAVLVMLAGKSCAESITKSNSSSSTKSEFSIAAETGTASPEKKSGQAVTYEVTQGNSPNVEYVTDILGRVIETVPVPETDPPTTEPPVEYITDILGRVQGTVGRERDPEQSYTEYVTDILGRVVDTVEHKATTTADENEPVETTTEEKLNPLEKYWRENPPEEPERGGQSGNSGQRETAPSEIHIKITQ